MKADMDRKDEIKQILLKNDRTIVWLSSKIPGHDFYYLLNNRAKKIDADLYDEIMQLFRKEGFLDETIKKSESIYAQLLNINALIDSSLSLLNHTACEYLKDNVLTFRERKSLMEMIEKIEVDFVEALAPLKKKVED
jgi:hypothetical protein